MKGYKATDENMCCRGFQYELGKTHEVKGKLELCENGFHFCEKLIAIDDYYDLSTSRVFEVEATGEIKSDGLKLCTKEIEFIRELSKDKIIKLANEAINDVDVYIRMTLAKSKIALPKTLEILSKDEDISVRCGVVENLNINKKILSKLSQDEEYFVRTAVAYNPNTAAKLLEMLSKDLNKYVRITVANNLNTSIKVLETLSNDTEYEVRYAVAKNVNTSIKTLKSLSRNEDLYIQRLAEATLANKSNL